MLTRDQGGRLAAKLHDAGFDVDLCLGQSIAHPQAPKDAGRQAHVSLTINGIRFSIAELTKASTIATGAGATMVVDFEERKVKIQ